MPKQPIRIFIAYSRQDIAYLNKLKDVLKPLVNKGAAQIWYDGEIIAGSVWEESIKKALHEAQIILLLLSNDSLASDYFYEKEVANALERHRQGQCRVVPVIIRDCLWEETNLTQLQALPQDAKPIAAWQDVDAAYKSIGTGISKLIANIQAQQEQTEDKQPQQLNKNQLDDLIPQQPQNTDLLKKIGMGAAGVLLLLLLVWGVSKIRGGAGQPSTIELPNAPDADPFAAQMVQVQGGTFKMGCTTEQGSDCYDDERPAKSTTVGAFYIGKYEVTQAQWTAIMGNNPSDFSGCNNCPVETVSYDDVQQFLQKLNAKTGKSYQLPTEAEWEYATRGGNRSKGYKYAGGTNIGSVAWYKDNSSDKTHPVGQKNANELGLYDLSGNIWEWTNSTEGSNRVARGGSWSDSTRICRVSNRGNFSPSLRDNALGFRVSRH